MEKDQASEVSVQKEIVEKGNTDKKSAEKESDYYEAWFSEPLSRKMDKFEGFFDIIMTILDRRSCLATICRVLK